MELAWWKKFVLSLLPDSPIFSGVKERIFTALIGAFSEAGKTVSDESLKNVSDLFPDTTNRADDWSDQFGYVGTLTTDYLKARFAETGGQSPNYLQTQLHAAGYTNLFVHEWWEPGVSPVTARNPITLINDIYPNNLLVNPVDTIYDDRPQCGDDPDEIQCGNEITDPGTAMQCGDSEGIKYIEKIYEHADVAAEYPYYFYVCAETWPDAAAVSGDEREEIKQIIYKFKPLEQRCVLILNTDLYVNTPTSGTEIWVNEPTTGADGIWVNLGE